MVAALSLFSEAAFAQSDKEALRARFGDGLVQYEAGHIEEALAIWKPIYDELGKEAGYRLAFNIARAEERLHDVRAAATWYGAYLAGIDARRQRGDAIEAGMLGQEVEARDRLAVLARDLVRFESNVAGAALGIDGEQEVTTPATVYALPGPHTVQLTRDKKVLALRHEDFQRGTIVVITPPERPIAPPSSPIVREVRPYSAALPITLLGLAGAGSIATVAGYVRTSGLYDSYVAAGPEARLGFAESHASARTFSYAALTTTLVLAAAAVGLGAYYWLGTTERTELQAAARPRAVR